MAAANPSHDPSGADNGASPSLGGAASMSASTPQSTTPIAPAWSSQMSSFAANSTAPAGSSFPQFSASTAAILERLQGKGGHASGSAAFEAKRAEILQNYVTSDKLPTPPPITNSGRRARGGRIGTPSHLKSEVAASPASAPSGRGSSRGRGRGKGRGGGRGGKRKRSESDDESNASSP